MKRKTKIVHFNLFKIDSTKKNLSMQKGRCIGQEVRKEKGKLHMQLHANSGP